MKKKLKKNTYFFLIMPKKQLLPTEYLHVFQTCRGYSHHYFIKLFSHKKMLSRPLNSSLRCGSLNYAHLIFTLITFNFTRPTFFASQPNLWALKHFTHVSCHRCIAWWRLLTQKFFFSLCLIISLFFLTCILICIYLTPHPYHSWKTIETLHFTSSLLLRVHSRKTNNIPAILTHVLPSS